MDKHHILPRYMGGPDTMDNIVTVTRTCHTMWHFANWQLWGNQEDYLAYKGLGGTIPELEIHREKRRLGGRKSFENKTGLFAMSKEEKEQAGSKGGKLGGQRMGNYKWINNGERNSRIPKEMEIPEGWKAGVIRKNPAQDKRKYGTRADHAAVQRQEAKVLRENRMKDIIEVGTKRGRWVKLARRWKVTPAQARRYAMLLIGIEPI